MPAIQFVIEAALSTDGPNAQTRSCHLPSELIPPRFVFRIFSLDVENSIEI